MKKRGVPLEGLSYLIDPCGFGRTLFLGEVAGGPHVATVGKRGHIHFVTVQPGRYLGRDIEIVDGHRSGARVLPSPPPDFADEMLVHPAPMP